MDGNTAMKCPTDVASLLLRIIGLALLNVRGFGFTKGDANRCAIEADHVHNLPDLIENFSAGALRYYLDVSRAQYRRLIANEPGTSKLFESVWDQLDEYMKTVH
jgi:hypothetical protein